MTESKIPGFTKTEDESGLVSFECEHCSWRSPRTYPHVARLLAKQHLTVQHLTLQS